MHKKDIFQIFPEIVCMGKTNPENASKLKARCGAQALWGCKSGRERGKAQEIMAKNGRKLVHIQQCLLSAGGK